VCVEEIIGDVDGEAGIAKFSIPTDQRSKIIRPRSFDTLPNVTITAFWLLRVAQSREALG
jgi:hypothetical protein